MRNSQNTDFSYFLNKFRFPYICSNSKIFTCILLYVLNYTGTFPLTDVVDNWGSIMTVAIIYSNIVTVLTYVFGILLKKTHRMSGNAFYDMFMGAILNPRIGK